MWFLAFASVAVTVAGTAVNARDALRFTPSSIRDAVDGVASWRRRKDERVGAYDYGQALGGVGLVGILGFVGIAAWRLSEKERVANLTLKQFVSVRSFPAMGAFGTILGFGCIFVQLTDNAWVVLAWGVLILASALLAVVVAITGRPRACVPPILRDVRRPTWRGDDRID